MLLVVISVYTHSTVLLDSLFCEVLAVLDIGISWKSRCYVPSAEAIYSNS
jgi:hypothetical protein